MRFYPGENSQRRQLPAAWTPGRGEGVRRECGLPKLTAIGPGRCLRDAPEAHGSACALRGTALAEPLPGGAPGCTALRLLPGLGSPHTAARSPAPVGPAPGAPPPPSTARSSVLRSLCLERPRHADAQPFLRVRGTLGCGGPSGTSRWLLCSF